MMAGLLSLLRLDPMFSIYQKIASGAQKNGPGCRFAANCRSAGNCRFAGQSVFFLLFFGFLGEPFSGFCDFCRRARGPRASRGEILILI